MPKTSVSVLRELIIKKEGGSCITPAQIFYVFYCKLLIILIITDRCYEQLLSLQQKHTITRTIIIIQQKLSSPKKPLPILCTPSIYKIFMAFCIYENGSKPLLLIYYANFLFRLILCARLLYDIIEHHLYGTFRETCFIVDFRSLQCFLKK